MKDGLESSFGSGSGWGLEDEEIEARRRSEEEDRRRERERERESGWMNFEEEDLMAGRLLKACVDEDAAAVKRNDHFGAGDE